MPWLIVFAGPNGSGKSTFISQMTAGSSELDFSLPARVMNPDDFARAVDPLSPDRVEIEAARAVLQQRARLLAMRLDFAVETTLSGRGELRLLQQARATGYDIGLVFIATEEPMTNIIRIARRREEQNRDSLQPPFSGDSSEASIKSPTPSSSAISRTFTITRVPISERSCIAATDASSGAQHTCLLGRSEP